MSRNEKIPRSAAGDSTQKRNKKDRLRRTGTFVLVSVAHIILLFFIVFSVEVKAGTIEMPASVFKLADIQEALPPALPPKKEEPPPKEPEPVEMPVAETIAETMIEVDEKPPESAPPLPSAAQPSNSDAFLPQNKVSILPSLSEREIRSNLIYPPIALRASIEGTVYLELFIDREGNIKRIRILKEDPPNRGFGEAAVRAFQGLRAKPAQANGEPVAVRYRYPVSFKIR
jgi:protein TonB